MNNLGYISVDKLIEFANNHVAGIDANDIARFPRADVEEVRHGEWIDTGSGQKCSVCGEIQYGYDNYRYRCSYCGAKMDGKEKEE